MMHRYTRRDFLKNSAAGATAAGLLPGLVMGRSPARRRPNVVILFIDDLGYGDLGCFGNRRIPTPHMDSMAAGGALCTMSYVTNPPCSPSRCCVMTGMYTQRFGKSGMARGVPIPEDHPTLAEFLRDAGYVTGQIGKWDIGSAEQGPHQRGFMHVARRAPGEHYHRTREDGSPVYRTEQEGDYMADFVERNHDRPFFLYASPFAVHSPLEGTPEAYRARVRGGEGTPYEGAVVALDDAVGKLLFVLKKHALERDTLLLLASDNGPNLTTGGGGSSAPYRGGKLKGNTMYEGWVHIPTLVSWPGTIPAGTTYDGLLCTMDFYATAAAAAGKPLPERCEGRDLVPYLRGEVSGDVHDVLFWHNADPTDAERRRLSAVRWKEWRLVKYPDGWRLFDLRNDPQETENLAGGHRETVAVMRKRHEAFVATLPPIKRGADYKGGTSIEPGWGWMVGDGGLSNRRGRTDPEKPAAATK